MSQLGRPITAALLEFAQTVEGSVRLHEQRVVQYTVLLTPEGEFMTVLAHPSPVRSKGVDSLPRYTVLAPREVMKRTNVPSPLLITDNAKYVLGFNDKGEAEQEKAKLAHRRYLELLQKHAHAHPFVAAIAKVVPTLRHDDFPKLSPESLIAFSIGGVNPHTVGAVQQLWLSEAQEILERRRVQKGGTEELPTFDAITGERASLTSNAPNLVKISDSGQVLVFQSRNPQNLRTGRGSESLGISQENIEALSMALKKLIGSPQHTLRISKNPPSILLHWLSGPAVDPFGHLMESHPDDLYSPRQADLHEQLRAQQNPGIHDEKTQAHLMLIGESGARLLVRDYQSAPLSVVTRHAWRFRQVIGGQHIMAVAAALYGEKAAPVNKINTLYMHAYMGRPLPKQFATSLLKRVLRDLPRKLPSGPELAALRLTLNLAPTEDYTLETIKQAPPNLRTPYALGLYAAYAHDAHRQGNKGVGQTVVETHMNLLTTQPNLALPKIVLRLGKVLKSYGLRFPKQSRELSERLDHHLAAVQNGTIPSRMTPEQQTAFLLGYAHGSDEISQARAQMWAAREKAELSNPLTAQE